MKLNFMKKVLINISLILVILINVFAVRIITNCFITVDCSQKLINICAFNKKYNYQIYFFEVNSIVLVQDGINKKLYKIKINTNSYEDNEHFFSFVSLSYLKSKRKLKEIAILLNDTILNT